MDDIEIIIFDEEELTSTLIESYLGGLTFPCNIQKYNEFNSDMLDDNSTSKIVIVNINDTDNTIYDKISQYSCSKKIKIIAMSYNGSANLQVKSFRAGAKDFLIKPLIKSDFVNTVQSIYEKYIHKTNKNSIGKIFTAISNHKGDGKSGFLINLAKETADVSSEKVLLLDFNCSQDGISLLLNANIMHNTNYYINNLTEDNAPALLSTVSKYKESSLYIMANSFAKNKTGTVKKDKLENSLNILKRNFKYIFIDINSDDNTIEDEKIINYSDEVFCLVLPLISSFDRIKDVLDNNYKDKNIKIILNQYTAGDSYKIEKIQTSLGREIFWKIPKNYTVSNNALNSNTTIKEAAEGSEIANSYFELAKCMVNRD